MLWCCGCASRGIQPVRKSYCSIPSFLMIYLVDPVYVVINVEKVGWLNKCREFVKYEFVCRLVVRRLIALRQGWTSWLLLDTSWCSRAAMYVPVTLKATLPDCQRSGVNLTTKQEQGQLAFLLLRRFALFEADAHLFVWRVLNSRIEENILIHRNSSKSQSLKSWVATSFLLSFTIL